MLCCVVRGSRLSPRNRITRPRSTLGGAPAPALGVWRAASTIAYDASSACTTTVHRRTRACRPAGVFGRMPSGPEAIRDATGKLSRNPSAHPVEGGSANDYDYAAGDPVNSYDLDGTEVRGRCTTVEGYGVVGGSVTACDLRDDRGNRTQTISVGGGVGLALAGSTGVYYSNAPTVNDVLGWSECQAGSYGLGSAQLCFFKAGPGRESYFSVYGGVGPPGGGGSISAVRTYRPNRFVRGFIRGVTLTPPKCSWAGGGGRCRFESY